MICGRQCLSIHGAIRPGKLPKVYMVYVWILDGGSSRLAYFPNENLFFLERSFVILLGKGSFQALLNQIESIVQTRIF